MCYLGAMRPPPPAKSEHDRSSSPLEKLSPPSPAALSSILSLAPGALSVLLVFACLAPPPAPAEPGRLCDLAPARERPEGAPRPGDVIMRSLSLHPANARDPHDTMRALRDFHATTLAWAYIEDAEFIRKVKESGRAFGGAASAPSYIGEKPDADWMKGVAVLNRKGEVLIAPWKRTWNHPTLWGCVNNPELERGYNEYLRRYIDAGAEIMQRDEPGSNDNAVRWGGCFCDHCMKGFRDYLASHTTAGERGKLGIEPLKSFDYRAHLDRQKAPVGDEFDRWDGGPLKELFAAFQLESTVAFHQRTRYALNEYAGREVPFSCNNGVRHWGEIERVFDWAFGELSYSHATAPDLYRAFREAAAHGRAQIVTMPKKGDQLDPGEWQRRTRRTIAMACACGGHCMVPWDVYMPKDAPRYFGTPEQYADLFGFIRANRRFLDDYEQAEATGFGVPAAEQGAAGSVFLAGGERVSVGVRAVPGRRDAPVVIHLVDWSEKPEPFTLMLRPERFFGDQPLKVSLLRPVPYRADAHGKADQTGDYRALSQETLLCEGRVAAAAIPALDPWAIVVVEPSKAEAGAVWQPAVCADPESRFRNELRVHIECATPGAAIHFTLDGAAPDRDSPLYSGPLPLDKSAEVRAIAFSASRSSAETRAHFQRAEGAVSPVRPDADSLKASLALWLSAGTLSKDLKDGDPAPRWPARAGPPATVPDTKLMNGQKATPPTFEIAALNGQPALRFDGQSNQFHVPSFANESLAGSAFTLFLVARSDSPTFGIGGNSKSGSGGIPRLYLTRTDYRYHELERSLPARAPEGATAISVFAHDGDETISAWVNSESKGTLSGLKVVSEFGGGGNLSLPFHSGNRNQPGELAEIIAFTRLLTDNERRGVEAWLADRYAIPVKCWK